MSGRLWEQKRIVRYYLHRWPSQTAMDRVRGKVRDRTGRNRVGSGYPRCDRGVESDPARLGQLLSHRQRRRASSVRSTGYVVWRLFRLLIKKRGRNLRAGQADQWTEEWFNGHGLHRLRGTIRYPKAA